MLIISMFGVAFNTLIAQPDNTIYIYPDGTIQPAWAPIARVGNVYTLTMDIYGWEIHVCGGVSDIVLDGDGHTVSGSGSAITLGLEALYAPTPLVYGVTVKNTYIIGCGGIALAGDNNVIINNTISNNSHEGIALYGSRYNIISNNTISNNGGESLTEAGIFIGVIELPVLGWRLSIDNKITGNMISKNYKDGITVWGGFMGNNIISNNTISNNGDDGIGLDATIDNTISGNKILNSNGVGIRLDRSSGNVIHNNDILENTLDGIRLDSSGHNVITHNRIWNNSDVGIYLSSSSDNIFHHNHVMCNRVQAEGDGVNTWDNGEEGNYWGDYEERYPDAEERDSWGVWDTPYIINNDNIDRFPLMGRISLSAPEGLTINFRWKGYSSRLREWILPLGFIRIGSKGYDGKVIVRGCEVQSREQVFHLYIGEKYEGHLEKTYSLKKTGQQGDSVDVPIFLGYLGGRKREMNWTNILPITVTTVEECVIKMYTAEIVVEFVDVRECDNGKLVATGGEVTFTTLLEGGSWAWIGSEAELPPGWSYSVAPPDNTLFETPYLITLNITAAPDAKEGDIGIVTLRAFSNETKLMFWQFVYFAAVDSTPPTIEVQTPVETPEGLMINATVEDLVTGVDSVQLFYSVDDGPWNNKTMEWFSGDTFNSTTFILTIPPIPKNSTLRYYIIATDWVDNEAQSETQIYTRLATDVNGDGKVDIRDIAIVAKAYGSKPGDPNWNEIADVAKPYGVINIMDIATVAKDYGKTA
ncbi:MAG: right-handed parallel beta-helix repeat-containing protein [Candidatus Bathyarchaeota archaeon]|nr:right-handed parallel beta-helix repeat-containing protein [Candidatus Bathyarchaeota archaeon]MDH5595377.1 right-handed parallel beta-helix repeat-containing protein [Candidatus Bathyarchaeota archaeon]